MKHLKSPTSNHDEDELSLRDILGFCCRRWLWFLGSVSLSIILAIVYLLHATPRFEIKVSIDKPLEYQIASLNEGRSNLAELPIYSNDQVFSYFVSELVSEHSFQMFFRELYIPSLSAPQKNRPESSLYQEAKKLFSISVPDGKPHSPLTYQLIISADSPEKSHAWLLGFLSKVDASAKSALLSDSRSRMQVMIHNTNKDIDELKSIALKKRGDRTIQLKEALHVANAINLKSPQVTQAHLPNGDSLRPFIDGSALYARGTKSLSAELELLEKRELDDAFITNLRETESRLKLRQAALAHQPTFNTHRVDGAIIPPSDPVAPRKGFVLAFAAIAGLIIGLIAAGIAESLTRRSANSNHHPAS